MDIGPGQLFEASYSPYLNPTDNIWSWLKTKVSKENIDQLERLIKKHWKNITPEMIQPYINGMEQYFRDVLNRNGGEGYGQN